MMPMNWSQMLIIDGLQDVSKNVVKVLSDRSNTDQLDTGIKVASLPKDLSLKEQTQHFYKI